MKNEITLQTRREFLRTTVLGTAVARYKPASEKGIIAQ